MPVQVTLDVICKLIGAELNFQASGGSSASRPARPARAHKAGLAMAEPLVLIRGLSEFRVAEVVFLGQCGTGKTALIRQFVNRTDGLHR